uniref:Alternative protein GALNT11 n=1 Tax=Homo sapiens TaxID=9606 RepID=L8EB40_HUMAN|nr:alternative protein GALNT11 [Homo sapiens]
MLLICLSVTAWATTEMCQTQGMQHVKKSSTHLTCQLLVLLSVSIMKRFLPCFGQCTVS